MKTAAAAVTAAGTEVAKAAERRLM
ncbi:MAG: hypothetical protein LH472_02735 [Pyrinomonadaceae bacterium]|nr:hypothetical protein [Pyrinomonadaceae bacterium]